MKKFELVADQSIQFMGVTLFRIRALVSFGCVESGDVGGFVEKESNLDNAGGNAWIYGDARISGNARISGDARIDGNARISGNARIDGNAWIYGDARISGNARISGDAYIDGNARISGDARISGNARISGCSSFCWFSKVGSENGTLTAFAAKAGLSVTRGCFSGTLESFVLAVDKKHGDSKIGKEYKLLAEVIKSRLSDAQEKLSDDE